VQLWIEYDPRPPFGGIGWGKVDRDKFLPVFLQDVREQLSDRAGPFARGGDPVTTVRSPNSTENGMTISLEVTPWLRM
jgi:hypothetical protein